MNILDLPIVETIARKLNLAEPLGNFKWKRTKASLLEGDDLLCNFDGSENKNKKKHMEILLDNLRIDQKRVYPPEFKRDDTYHELVHEISRQVFPALIANEIVGVQPMTAPLQYINVLRTRLSTDLDRKGSIDLSILKEIAEAKVYKSDAKIPSKEVYMEFPALKSEISNAISQEMVSEFDQKLLNQIRSLIGEPDSIFDQSSVGDTKTFIGDVHAALAILINRRSNLISSRTRRGGGNWCVVSPTAFTIMMSATTTAFSRTSEDTFGENITSKFQPKSTSTKFVGMLNNSIKVYCDPYASDIVPVLIGYKGYDTDAGLIYNPYIPVLVSGPYIDPVSTKSFTTLASRYGLYEMQEQDSFLCSAKDYYGSVGVNVKTLSFV